MGITQQQQLTAELKQKMEADFEAQLKKALQARELSSLKNELEQSTDVDKQQQPQRTNQQNHRLEEDEFDFEHDDTSNAQDDGLGAVGDLETMADETAAAARATALLRSDQIRGVQSRDQARSIMIPSLLKQGTTTPRRRGGSLVVASPKNNDNNSKHQVPLQKRAVASRLCGNKLVEAIIRVCNGCVKPAGGKPVSAKRCKFISLSSI
ncbi:unnamed protein product [Anisakis simplex]|uniref:Uncharacterized protein n=1 Tax=Anisakis simplex TaxID=6269 RepID=A0A0M3J370_ANISI|nr:unnamed protein product [Anisakis simplex]